jgi:hypothetical protein
MANLRQKLLATAIMSAAGDLQRARPIDLCAGRRTARGFNALK